MSGIRSDVAVQLQTSVAGDQRENILDLWRSSLNEKGVNINEFESCKSISRAEDGDYFTIQTERGTEKLPGSYTARRVVIAIGLRGSPNKLRLPNEDLTVIIRGREGKKVHYELPNPDDFCGYNIAVVGGDQQQPGLRFEFQAFIGAGQQGQRTQNGECNPGFSGKGHQGEVSGEVLKSHNSQSEATLETILSRRTRRAS
jgi:hypothetical protein